MKLGNAFEGLWHVNCKSLRREEKACLLAQNVMNHKTFFILNFLSSAQEAQWMRKAGSLTGRDPVVLFGSGGATDYLGHRGVISGF